MKPRNAFISLTLVFLIGVGIYGYQQEIFPFQTDTVAVTSSDQTNSVENSSEEEVWSNDYSVVNIGDLTKEMVGRKVTVVGSAGKISRTSSGHTFVTLQDATEQIEIPVFSNLDIDTSNLKEGDKLEVRGKVDLYEDELQVIPEVTSDFLIVGTAAVKKEPETSAASTETASNDKSAASSTHPLRNSIGKTEKIEGIIVKKSPISDGNIFLTLEGTDGYETVVPLFASLSPTTLTINEQDKIHVTGKVKEYKGEMQVIPNSIGDVSLNLDSAKKEQSSTGKGISSITKSQLGEVLEVKGVVSNYFLSDKGNVFVDLSDDTGGIRVVLFYDSDQDYKNAVGVLEDAASRQKSVTLEGKVNEYKGDLQLILQKVR